MNYSPNDLQNITFKKGIMGYNEDAVNEALDRVIEDYNAYIKENIELKDKLAIMNEGLQHYKNIEESLQNTLVVAQQTSEEIKKSAYAKADVISREAEFKAQKIIEDANQEVLKIKFEYEDMKKRLHIYKSKSETLLLSQLEVLKQMFDDGNENESA
jgi:DivIVA domain